MGAAAVALGKAEGRRPKWARAAEGARRASPKGAVSQSTLGGVLRGSAAAPFFLGKPKARSVAEGIGMRTRKGGDPERGSGRSLPARCPKGNPPYYDLTDYATLATVASAHFGHGDTS